MSMRASIEQGGSFVLLSVHRSDVPGIYEVLYGLIICRRLGNWWDIDMLLKQTAILFLAQYPGILRQQSPF